jgi:ferredoxin
LALKVITHKGSCIGSGFCVSSCPEVFGQDDDLMVDLLDENPPESLRVQVLQAVDGCPGGVIEVED